MLQKSPLVLLVVFVLTATAFSQDRVKELAVNGGCNYYGEPLGSKIYTFDSEEDAIAAVDKILIPTGLVRRFNIRAADVPNAAAIIYGEDRYILYNQAFMRRVKSQTNTDWAAISIMAHELGHHLDGHTLISGGSRPLTELEADSFSGFVLYKMGATLDEAQAAMKAFGSETGSATHPPKHSRLAAIEAGWTKAKNLGQTTSTSKSQYTYQISGSVNGTPVYRETREHKVMFPFQGGLSDFRLTVKQFTNGRYCATGVINPSSTSFPPGSTNDDTGIPRIYFAGAVQGEGKNLALYLNPGTTCEAQ